MYWLQNMHHVCSQCQQASVLWLCNNVQGAEDKVERALLSLAADRRPVQGGGGEDDRAGHSAEWDTLAAPDWPGVPEKAMLLSPSRCRALWRQFTSDTNFIVQQVSACCRDCLPP